MHHPIQRTKNMSKTHIAFLPHSFLFLVLLSVPFITVLVTAADGKWDMLLSNIGIVAMHVQLLHTDRVLIFDRTDFGLSNISLPNGKCRYDPNEKAVKVDCSAHSVEYDVASNSIRPLMVQTDVWCSSGGVMSDGTMVQTGGFGDGDHIIRSYKPCTDGSCDWQELSGGLAQRRWYASNHVLPDGRQIIIGGRRQFNYEFHPKSSPTEGVYNLPFLVQTNDRRIENNLYPFVFLNRDGNLFIFANNHAILFDYTKNAVLRTYPSIPGGDPRNYPSTGSAVLLPLFTNNKEAEVLVCGGAPKGSFVSVNSSSIFVKALDTCGRIQINDPNPQWVMEKMPMQRVMGDMVMLPNGNVLIINGAGSGTAGWEFGRDPVLSPVLYRTNNPVGSRFEVQNPSSIPRMYHSTAILLRDGRVLVSGSNPHERYEFSNVLFPTELKMEAFSPSYLDQKFGNLRPQIVSPVSQSKIGYGLQLPIRFKIPAPGKFDVASVKVTMVAPSFTTHSFGMNQRLLVLGGGNVTAVARFTYQIQIVTPNSGNLAPAGYYILYVVYKDIPSEGIWVQIQ